jgi:hypothetical protein
VPRTTTTISIFLASPNDVSAERELVVRAVNEWNTIRGRSKSIYFEILRWESSVPAGFGNDGQDFINSTISDQYDVFIALFWTRVGSATPRAISGSVEEYDRALQRYETGEDIQIAFYFKDYPIEIKSIDLDQISSLRDLKKRLEKDGAFYKEFKQEENLRFEIDLLLDKSSRHFSIDRQLINSSINLSSGVSDSKSLAALIVDTVPLAPTEDIIATDEPGVIEIAEALLFHTEGASKFLIEMNSRMENLSNGAQAATDSMAEGAKLGPLSPIDVKPFIIRISDEMNSFSSFLEDGLPNFTDNSLQITQNIRMMIDISQDFDPDQDDVAELRSTLVILAASMSGACASLNDLKQSVLDLQRMSTQFNKARRRLVLIVGDLASTIESTLDIVMESITNLDLIAAPELTHLAENH